MTKPDRRGYNKQIENLKSARALAKHLRKIRAEYSHKVQSNRVDG